MQKALFLLLFGSAVLIGFTEISGGTGENELVPLYIGILVLALIPLWVVLRGLREHSLSERRAEEALQSVRVTSLVRREVKAKIPKHAPRRESQITRDGLAKLSSIRSMAALIRKPRLREKVLEICDFADLVLETICRMPEDTPAAVAFIENHLVRLQEALERCFELYRTTEYKKIAAMDTDTYEIECFGAFITAFCKQQDSILFEGLGADRSRSGILV